MYVQRDFMRDFVFPVASANKLSDGYEYRAFYGSGFLIGSRGYCLTAAHVVKNQPTQNLVGMFVGEDNGWYAFPLAVLDCHPNEDVALLKLEGGPWTSPFVISDSWEGQGRDYQLFGYPTDAFISSDSRAERTLSVPDLIFSKGHIRRRISGDLVIPNIKSSRYFELSTVAGEGCSGSPVFYISANGRWSVVGVYVGEKTNDRATSVSYAVRAESFSSWFPAGLERSVKEESEDKL